MWMWFYFIIKINDQEGLPQDPASWKAETDLLLSFRPYDDDRSLGLTGINWVYNLLYFILSYFIFFIKGGFEQWPPNPQYLVLYYLSHKFSDIFVLLEYFIRYVWLPRRLTYWLIFGIQNDSLGPFDLGMSAQKVIAEDSLSIGGFVR